MFERVKLRVADLGEAERFYATVLAAVAIARTSDDGDDGPAWGDFALAQATAELPPTRGLHVGFAVGSRAAVDAFHAAGVAGGHRDDGPPGPRPQYLPDYYGAFLLDPGGNSAEAVHYDGVRADGTIDHLWIGVADLPASRAWYEALAPAAGWRTRGVHGEHVHFGGAGPAGSFALVADGRPPTAGAQLAVRAADPARASVHRDPDGNRVELLCGG